MPAQVWEPSTRRAVVTERVLRDNPWLVNRTSLSADGAPPRPTGAAVPYAGAPAISDAELSLGAARLESILSAALVGAEEGSGEYSGADVTVAIVPEEEGAPRLGHIDGVCNWLGPNTIALSNFAALGAEYVAIYDAYRDKLTAAFGSGVTIVPFPYYPTLDTWIDGYESAAGTSFGLYLQGAAGPQLGVWSYALSSKSIHYGRFISSLTSTADPTGNRTRNGERNFTRRKGYFRGKCDA